MGILNDFSSLLVGSSLCSYGKSFGLLDKNITLIFSSFAESKLDTAGT